MALYLSVRTIMQKNRELLDLLDPLEDVLSFDLTAHLLGVSREQLFKYDALSEDITSHVEARVRFLNAVCGYLLGAYNDDGIRAWFLRKRVQLDNKSPAGVLSGEWNPDDAKPRAVLKLARQLIS